MKKIIVSAILIATCGSLCASVWPQSGVDEEIPAEVAVRAIFADES